jgi:hypothetical protein
MSVSQETKDKIRKLCEQGYRSSDPDKYQKIDDILATLEQTQIVSIMRRLCQAGPEGISKKFAFPHIEDRINSL